MEIKISKEAVEGMTYHTEDPATIYDMILGTLKPEIIKFIADVVSKKSHYPKEEARVITKWPTTVEAAVEIVYKPLNVAFKCDFIKESKEKTLPQFHSTMGRRIRNMFGLWAGNNALMEDAGASHPDECSWAIMEAIYDKCLEDDKWLKYIQQCLMSL